MSSHLIVKLYFNIDLQSVATYLNEQPRRNQSQTTILAIKPIVIGVEEKMIEIEES